MNKVKRYDLGVQPGYYGRPCMDEDETGAWVCFEDYETLLKTAKELATYIDFCKVGLRGLYPNDPCDNTMEQYCMECRVSIGGKHEESCAVGKALELLKETPNER